MNKPILTEPGVKYWLSKTLKECHGFKDKHISFIYNIAMLVILVMVISGFLSYKYKGYISPEELAEKNKQKQEFIVSKLQQLALYKKQNVNNMWEHDVFNRKIYN